MASLSNASTSSDVDPSPPRRAGLRQARSRDTRRKLIRAALQLWDERGFERAIEETTAEEIARAAGVSKGTFYFHFAHKEDILLEMPWATAEVMEEEADRALRRGDATDDLIAQLMASLARRVSRAPRGAVLRVVGTWPRLSPGGTELDTPRGFGQVFGEVLAHGVRRGELPGATDVDEVAALLQAATMDALVRWAATTQTSTALRATLCRRAEVVLRGAAAAYGASTTAPEAPPAAPTAPGSSY